MPGSTCISLWGWKGVAYTHTLSLSLSLSPLLLQPAQHHLVSPKRVEHMRDCSSSSFTPLSGLVISVWCLFVAFVGFCNGVAIHPTFHNLDLVGC